MSLASCIPANWSVSAAFSAEGNPASYAIDGIGSTRWSNGAGQGPGEYYQIAFGGWVTIDQVVLDSAGSEGDYPRGYEVLASKDGTTFTKVLAKDALVAAPEGDKITIDFDPIPLQALRIGTTIASGNWWSVHELSLSCEGSDDGTPPVDPLLCTPEGSAEGAGGAGAGGAAGGGAGGQDDGAGGQDDGAGGQDDGASAVALDPANWIATASSTSEDDSVADAFDGALGTRWSSGKAQVGGEWFLLDLGSVACISSLWIVSGGGDFATGFKIEVSVDGVDYFEIAKGTGSAVSQIQFKPHSARYVRINQVAAGGANWWSIQELEVRP